MKLARIAIATALVAAMGGCSKANDDAEAARAAEMSSGTDMMRDEQALENSSAVYGEPGHTPGEGTADPRMPAPVGVGMSAPGTGNTAEERQPTGPGTAGENVTTGGPGAVNSPSGASGKLNLGN